MVYPVHLKQPTTCPGGRQITTLQGPLTQVQRCCERGLEAEEQLADAAAWY